MNLISNAHSHTQTQQAVQNNIFDTKQASHIKSNVVGVLCLLNLRK